jgi:hypothetical protein
MLTMNNPYGFLLGENFPSTLIKSQERACEIEEHLISSYPQNMNCPEETAQIDEVVNFIQTVPLSETFISQRHIYRWKKEGLPLNSIDHMINFIKKEKAQI